MISGMREQIRTAVRARHPVIYFHTAEEDRVLEALRDLSSELLGEERVSTWSCVDGLDCAGDGETRDAVRAVQWILERRPAGFFVMKDLSEFMGRPEVARALRDAYFKLLSQSQTFIVIIDPVIAIPEALENEVYLVDVDLPDADELLAHTLKIEGDYPGVQIPQQVHSEIALALRGLTLNEAGHVMRGVFAEGNVSELTILERIFAEKKRLLRRAPFLEFVPNRMDIERVGGLENVKEWAMNRAGLFTQEAVAKGLPIPKGVLIMGISGCGKSLTAKALASMWHLPIFRLDMNLIFSGMHGSPEAAFHKALKAIESIAPALLWIDEIENALGMTVDHATAEQSLTFSSFLTWMQERPPLVFVAATANRIEALPAEVLRKGRFDHVFFCDLPDSEERREIIQIHLNLNGAQPGDVEIEKLLNSTDGWTGAEIEQAIVAARIDADKEGRRFNTDDVKKHTLSMVPLSRTMEEQIRAIRDWAFDRATRAGRKRKRY